MEPISKGGCATEVWFNPAAQEHLPGTLETPLRRDPWVAEKLIAAGN